MIPCEHRKEVTNKRSPSPKIEAVVSKYRHSIYDTLVTYKSVIFPYKNLRFFCCHQRLCRLLVAPTNFIFFFHSTKFFHGLISFEFIFTCYLNSGIFLEGLGLLY
ncbi:hypothetical protein AMTRI_Chr04g184890 [Amborella trichopoda]